MSGSFRAPVLVAVFAVWAGTACGGGEDSHEPVRPGRSALKAAGEDCLAGTECDSGFCVDGVCCTTACTGTCQACAASQKQSLGQSGTCGPALEGTADPACASDGGGTCDWHGKCDDKGACALVPQGVACITGADAGNSCVVQGSKGEICSGGGACYLETSPAGVPCAPYACKNGSCVFPCLGDTDCESPNRCESGVCKPKRKNGDACDDKAQCGSGNCTDGVCCDTNCSGQCQACKLPGKEGTCSFVVGKPVEPRPDCSGSDECKGSCNGNGDKCGYPGKATTCGAALCTGDVSTAAPTCDSTGACAAGASAPCTPYGCDDATGVCRKSCASDSECSQGGKCDTTSGKCAIATVSCKDTTTVRLPNGQTESCAPYTCKAGKCTQQCVTGDDCAPGYVCQATACVVEDDAAAGGSGGSVSSGGAPSAGGKQGGSGASDDGGCGCTVPGSRAPEPWGLALAGLAGLLATWRARPRAQARRS